MTTIHSAAALEGYRLNFERHGHLNDVIAYVIPDAKTPSSVYDECAQLRRRGMDIRYPPLSDQDDFLALVGLAPELIPRNSDNRRNVGYLMALADGCNFLISIDDDNYVYDQSVDFFRAHSIVCAPSHYTDTVTQQTAWFNPVGMLEGAGNAYARGYPYFARSRNQPTVETEIAEHTVRVNAGLWLHEMDVDAFTCMCYPGMATGLKNNASVCLPPGVWGPINTQNTAIHRDAIPAFWFVRMGHPVGGLRIDRYGDIFAGYFMQACVKHMGGAVRYGAPLVEHLRNAHDYLRDARQELACIEMLEDILPWLIGIGLDGNTYPDAYRSLSHQLGYYVESLHGGIWDDSAAKQYIHRIANTMLLWTYACEEIG